MHNLLPRKICNSIWDVARRHKWDMQREITAPPTTNDNKPPRVKLYNIFHITILQIITSHHELHKKTRKHESLNLTGTKIRPVWLDRLVKIWPFQKLFVCHKKMPWKIYSEQVWRYLLKLDREVKLGLHWTSHWTRRASLVNRLGRLRSWLSMMHTIQRQCNDYHYHHQTITDSCLFQGLMEILDEFIQFWPTPAATVAVIFVLS